MAKEATRPIYEKLGISNLMLNEDPAEDVHIVRLLRYLNTDAEKPKAALHFDRSVATLAVRESMRGLVGSYGNNGYEIPITIEEAEDMAERAITSPVEYAANEAKFFLGAGFHHLPRRDMYEHEKLPLFLHGVKNHEPKIERDAVVIFMNPHRGVKHAVPTANETGFDEIRESILRRRPPYEDS